MGKQPFLALLVIGITPLQGQVTIDEEEGQGFHSLGLEEALDLYVLHKGQWLLRKIVSLHLDPMLLQLMKEPGDLWENRINIRATDSRGAAHGGIVNLDGIHCWRAGGVR